MDYHMLTLLHNCCFIYTQTSPPWDFPVACVSLSSLTGAPKLMIARSKSLSVDVNHVSLKAIMQVCLYWFW